MTQFAVVVTLTKQKAGNISIVTWLRVLEAVNEDEATGIGIREARASMEGYDVNTFLVAPVPQKVEA